MPWPGRSDRAASSIPLSPLIRFIWLVGGLTFQGGGFVLQLSCEFQKSLLRFGGGQIHSQCPSLFCGVAKLCNLCT